MWHLKSIKANNLCSFQELDFQPKQGEATLIFGNNLDSDSQNSNGSGKSALIEAIAIALTGDPLRKVNLDEIINDNADEAVITAVLNNPELQIQLTISRKISRRDPQEIIITRQRGPYDTDTDMVVLPSVLEYNRFILDQLGLTKDDIFSNFILTARKYRSFLCSSDKDKKELINRFSNGVLVDESIEAIRADIAPLQDQLTEADKKVALYTGKVEATDLAIEKALGEISSRKASTETQIKNWETLIAGRREAIRVNREKISEISDRLDSLDELDDAMQSVEKSDANELEALSKVQDMFLKHGLKLATDFLKEIDSLDYQLEEAQKEMKYASNQVDDLKSRLDNAEGAYNDAKADFQLRDKEIEQKKQQNADKIKELLALAASLQTSIDKSRDELMARQRDTNMLERKLAGVIQCPKCKHEFSFDLDEDVDSARQSLVQLKKTLDSLQSKIEGFETKYQATTAQGSQQRQLEHQLDMEEAEIHKALTESSRQLQNARQEYVKCESRIEEANVRLSDVNGKITRIRRRLFDEVFEIIDDTYKQEEARIKALETDEETARGAIESYERAIEEARNVSEENLIDSLKESRAQLMKDLRAVTHEQNIINGKLKELKGQESTFVEFKTYLANTKINAIAQITNYFLEAIGSDIRLALSGYTILKSGKVRDKISVSLLRNGIDCGSFEKFSAGERVRVELASILSMNKLMNANCEEGKGLDLLIADEVLDSADEQGLASVFKTLNNTQVTSLVVSHGNIAESYPNRILVTKQNGISYIDETYSENRRKADA